MSKLVRESINFERGGDPRKTMRVGKLARLKEKYGEEDLDILLGKVVESNNLNDLKVLIQQGVSINDEDADVLSIAAGEGQLDIVKYLVEHGADIEGPNGLGTPLCVAAGEGYLDIVKYLVEQGADINYISASDPIHSYALHFAAERGHLDIVKYLVEEGAHIHQNDDLPLKYAIDETESQEVADYLKSKMNDE